MSPERSSFGRRLSGCLLVAALVGVAGASAQTAWDPPADPDRPHVDERGLERFRWECRNEIGRREVTLFANGTVRLRSGSWGAMEMELEELTPAALDEVLRRLDLVRRSPSFPRPEEIRPWEGGLGGEGSETCLVHLDLPGSEPARFEYSIYDATPHAFARLKVIADDLAGGTRPLDSPERLPKSYEPRPEDVLRTAEGRLYRVIGLTDDRRGVELEPLDQPLRVYHSVDALDDLFVAVVGHGIDPATGEPLLRELEVREPN